MERSIEKLSREFELNFSVKEIEKILKDPTRTKSIFSNLNKSNQD